MLKSLGTQTKQQELRTERRQRVRNERARVKSGTSQTHRRQKNIQERLTLHNYIRKFSLLAVACGMSKVESDKHCRVKPTYNGTAGDQVFPFQEGSVYSELYNYFSNAHVYVMARFLLRQISLYMFARGRRNPSFEQPARKQEDLYPLLHGIQSVVT